MFQGAYVIFREKVPSVNYIDINIYPKFNNSRDRDGRNTSSCCSVLVTHDALASHCAGPSLSLTAKPRQACCVKYFEPQRRVYERYCEFVLLNIFVSLRY